jgi:hypothetical protein
MKMSKKKLMAIVLTLTTFLAMFAILRPAVSTEVIDVDNYCWIEGVLDSDTYALYPYAQESLDIGFSKYGEMIGYNEATGIGLGLQYPGYAGAGNTYDQTDDTSVDPFCNEYIGTDWWMNGWFIDIKYRTPAGSDREIWAMALFSDGVQYGGDWIIMPSVAADSPARPLWQEDPPYANPDSDKYTGEIDPIPAKGGRKTNGYCTTEDIEIIYNGPRKFIGIAKTTLSDVGGGTDLVCLTFTFIFNKAEKNVIILKDVKRLYTKQPMNVQFGNRGEWDLGIEGDTDSYTHWYTDEPVKYWDIDQDKDLNATEVETTFDFFKEYMASYKNPKKWWVDVPLADKPEYVYNEFTQALEEGFPPAWEQGLTTCYGRDWHWDKSIKDHSYAVAQVVSGAGDYVGALAVWPHPEFWSAANTYFPPARTIAPQGENPSSIALMLAPISRMTEWNRWTVAEDPNQGELGDLPDRDDIWITADDIRNPDGSTLEPVIPFTIYEHDFKLSSTQPAYRIVSVYTVTDYHDADDADAADPANDETWSAGKNIIDREIQYQLDEIFNPWDIYDAMHKSTKRWVQFFDADMWDEPWDGETTYQIQLDEEREVESGLLIPTLPVTNDGYWDMYCSDSERVLVDTGTGYELIRPIEYQNIDPIPIEPDEDEERPYYMLDHDTGMISFYEWDVDGDVYDEWFLPEDSLVKVLWSSEHTATTAEVWNLDIAPYNATHIFPLHHDVDWYKDWTEVFMVDAGNPTLLTDGDWVYNSASNNIYLQYPPGAGEWIWVEYDNATDSYLEFFKGDGKKTVFTLSFMPNGSVVVYHTKIVEHVIEEGVDDTVPSGYSENNTCMQVPKIDSYWSPTATYTYSPATHVVFSGQEEWEWLCRNVTEMIQGQYIIHESPVGNEFSTCDELVLDEGQAPDTELKIVFEVPSGRWEWGIVGQPSAALDSIGVAMTVAAFKNKLIEFGLGGLDRQDATFGPRLPWMMREDISPDSIGRYHLYDDWCTSFYDDFPGSCSWPISSSNIITVGGPSPNMVSKYFNDYAQAMAFTTAGDGFYAVTCWDRELSEYGFYPASTATSRYGYAIISTYKDKNGTIGFMLYGYTGQDTYFAAKWFDEHKFELQHINAHVTDLILEIEYKDATGDLYCPPLVSIVEKLGTISEKPQHDC